MYKRLKLNKRNIFDLIPGMTVLLAHNQNSALAHQNSEKRPSKQRKGYIATCKNVLIEIAQINYP